MALGGGTFLTQNKVLPGAYINFISTAAASAALADRGTALLALPLPWGPECTVFSVESGEFQKNSLQYFGSAYTADALQPVREVFCHAQTVCFFNLRSGGTAASCDFCTAAYPGARGNDLWIAVLSNAASTDEAPLYDVETYMDSTLVDEQTGVSSAEELEDSDFVLWTDSATLTLTAKTQLSGGADGTVEDANYQTCLDQAESRSFNALGCDTDDEIIKALFAAWAERMRDEVGKKMQVVLYDYPEADYEGVVSVCNDLADGTAGTALVPWVTGVIAGTAVNASATNMVYDGELEIDAGYTQSELEEAVAAGSFTFHQVDDEVRVLTDINTFVSVTDEKSADFSSNQVIRVLDQIANDIATIFCTKYIGKVQNDAGGRISLWNDIVKHHQQLQDIRAIEDFESGDVTVEPGDTKKSVVVTDCVTPVAAMEQLYMTVYVS